MFSAKQGGAMRQSALQTAWYPAGKAASRPDLHFRDLRHFGATKAAESGATLADLMARMGHSTPTAVMFHQHSASGRDAALVDAMSKAAVANRGRAARWHPRESNC